MFKKELGVVVEFKDGHEIKLPDVFRYDWLTVTVVFYRKTLVRVGTRLFSRKPIYDFEEDVVADFRHEDVFGIFAYYEESLKGNIMALHGHNPKQKKKIKAKRKKGKRR